MGMNVAAADAARRDNLLISNSLKLRYTPFAVARGEGANLFDLDGRRYLDFSAGWAVAQLGYSDARVRHAIERQLQQTTFAGLISSINTPALDLAEKLVSLTPGDFPKKVWFGQSGSDASEVAQRLVLRATGRRRLVSFIGSWHGTNDAAMSLSGHPSFAATPGGAHVTKAPYPNPYRPPFGDIRETSEELGERCLHFLEHYLFQTICPPQDVAAVFVEAVQSDAGDIVPPLTFLSGLRALCDRHGILLVVDEVKTGLGRTGRMFAFEHSGITPDLVLLGKALGGGLPLSAIVGRAEVLDAGSGALFTTVGNGTCCAAGLATIAALEADGLVEQAAVNGDYLHDRLACALDKYDIVGDVR